MQGTSKYFYLPEAHTDFAFAVWAQEMGFIGAVFVVVLIAAFTYFGFRISNKARDEFGKWLAMGITLLISGQALFNIAMVCGIMPVTGVPLPFVSYGGSSLLMNFMAIGLLASIGRRNVEGVNKLVQLNHYHLCVKKHKVVSSLLLRRVLIRQICLDRLNHGLLKSRLVDRLNLNVNI